MAGRYRSFSGARIGSEKRRDSNESDDAPSLVASRETPQPILGQRIRDKFASHLPRRRFSRSSPPAIASVLLLLILYLLWSSWTGPARAPASPPPEWEKFPFLKRYYGGIRTLVSRAQSQREYPRDEDVEVQRLRDAAMAQKEKADAETSKQKGFQKRDRMVPAGERFDPYPKYDSGAERALYEPPVPCHLDNGTLEAPQLLVYKGVTQGFPDPVMGSHQLLGLRDDVCFERYGRLGPYGFGYSKEHGGSGAGEKEGEREGAEAVWEGGRPQVDYRTVDWAEAQARCTTGNAHRFKSAPDAAQNHPFAAMATSGSVQDTHAQTRAGVAKTIHGKEFLNRTAVLVRTWADYKYDDEDIIYLRALINELAIQSGSEYAVHFLVHVKDNDLPIWSDRATYQRVLNDALPAEFRDLGVLWSERQMSLVYGGLAESNYRNLPVFGVYRSTYLPMQYFASLHPEYDFFWHWEMDIRYTGHFYHLFHQVSQWAKQQPRKRMWERSGRFYTPSQHGSWDDFRHLVEVQSEQGLHDGLATEKGAGDAMASRAKMLDKPIWGPLRPPGEGNQVADPDLDPVPPTPDDKDDGYEWGVGEEADFITFNPLFDPSRTNWILAEDVTGYNTSQGYPPRRTAIITASGLSHRLLMTMHRETALQRHTMFSEMWPGSCALHHGLKAVYAPHPVYIDRAWPTSYLTATFNNGRHGAAGGARTSVFSDERQHNFLGTTWYYHAGFSPNLWRRWLGLRVDGGGGEKWELENEGRMCIPAMLLHPIKHVDLIDGPREGG